MSTNRFDQTYFGRMEKPSIGIFPEMESVYDCPKKSWKYKSVAGEALHSRIVEAAQQRTDREAMEKDIHLIEAALVTDNSVVSMDDTARELFRGIAERVNTLKVGDRGESSERR